MTDHTQHGTVFVLPTRDISAYDAARDYPDAFALLRAAVERRDGTIDVDAVYRVACARVALLGDDAPDAVINEHDWLCLALGVDLLFDPFF